MNGTEHKIGFSLFFSQKDEVITLQPFVSLSFLKRGGVSLIGKHSPNSLCFVMPEDGQIILTSLFCSYVNIFRMTGALWNCKNSPPPLTLLRVFPHRFPIYFSICRDKWNQTRSALFLVPNSFPMWTELTLIMWIMIARNSQTLVAGMQTEVMLCWRSSS